MTRNFNETMLSDHGNGKFAVQHKAESPAVSIDSTVPSPAEKVRQLDSWSRMREHVMLN
jgi:hypothetical protein